MSDPQFLFDRRHEGGKNESAHEAQKEEGGNKKYATQIGSEGLGYRALLVRYNWIHDNPFALSK